MDEPVWVHQAHHQIIGKDITKDAVPALNNVYVTELIVTAAIKKDQTQLVPLPALLAGFLLPRIAKIMKASQCFHNQAAQANMLCIFHRTNYFEPKLVVDVFP